MMTVGELLTKLQKLPLEMPVVAIDGYSLRDVIRHRRTGYHLNGKWLTTEPSHSADPKREAEKVEILVL